MAGRRFSISADHLAEAGFPKLGHAQGTAHVARLPPEDAQHILRGQLLVDLPQILAALRPGPTIRRLCGLARVLRSRGRSLLRRVRRVRRQLFHAGSLLGGGVADCGPEAGLVFRRFELDRVAVVRRGHGDAGMDRRHDRPLRGAIEPVAQRRNALMQFRPEGEAGGRRCRNRD